MKILYFLIAALIIKFLLNLSRYLQCKWYLSKYQNYITNPEWGFVGDSPQIINLFKNAGIKDVVVTNVEFIGFGHFQSSHPSVFENLTVTRNDVVGAALNMFHKSIGVYRSRMLETINPLYWLEFIIFLPKHLLNYIGISPESIFIKIIQIIYWLLVFLFGVYREDFEGAIREWITNLF